MSKSVAVGLNKIILLALLTLLHLAVSAFAADYQAGQIRVVQPWSRATPPMAPVAGGYLKLVNIGTEPDRMTAISSPAFTRAEIHEMSIENGVAEMRPRPDGLEIRGGETLELKPGQIHIMFIKPAQPLKEGERFPATLTFQKAGAVQVEFVVLGMGAQSATGDD